MKKLFLSLFVLATAALNSSAQTTHTNSRFNIGVEAVLPLGGVRHLSQYGIGGAFKYEHPVAENLFITASAGFTRLFYKDVFQQNLDKAGMDFVPVKVGVKYYLSPRLFAEGQFGVALDVRDGVNSFFAYSSGVGYSFSKKFETSLRYEAWADNGTIHQLALRVAYKF